MDIHPWTKYEIARLRDEERLLRARAAMRAVELHESPLGQPEPARPSRTIALLDRFRQRGVATERAAAGSGAL